MCCYVVGPELDDGPEGRDGREVRMGEDADILNDEYEELKVVDDRRTHVGHTLELCGKPQAGDKT